MEATRQIRSADAATAGQPELTELGKCIEMLRIERGFSKQYLARFAGTSRQQLWRVMTGKSPLTVGLRARLADVLRVSALELESDVRRRGAQSAATDLHAYASDAGAIARTIATMPTGDDGRALKRRFLDALEDFAVSAGCDLDPHFFDVRRRVVNGEL